MKIDKLLLETRPGGDFAIPDEKFCTDVNAKRTYVKSLQR